MNRTVPPFRADHVGSLLRPDALKQARARRQAGEIDSDQLREVEDREIAAIVKRQEDVGLQSITDGEFRRSWWHLDFYWGLQGCERTAPQTGYQFAGMQTRAEGVRVAGKVDFPADHPMLAHFRFLNDQVKDHAGRTAKMTIPAPSVLHYRTRREGISTDAYPDLDDFFDDMGQTYRKAVTAFYDAGCRYLQIDDTSWGWLCSAEEMSKVRAQGEDPANLADAYARSVNVALADKPRDLVVTMHVCRGNYRSHWFVQGGYEPVADRLFGDVEVDGFFLEYDSERAGGFEPLRFLPKGKLAVLGLITSKSGALEKRDDIKRRIDEAGKFADVDQFCLSPQCGFGSTEEGNTLSEEQQWAKLKLTVDIAKEVWG
jgi:5-methyltetrahydropteroyltriglutamate--homocysteine methyltransferase